MENDAVAFSNRNVTCVINHFYCNYYASIAMYDRKSSS